MRCAPLCHVAFSRRAVDPEKNKKNLTWTQKREEKKNVAISVSIYWTENLTAHIHKINKTDNPSHVDFVALVVPPLVWDTKGGPLVWRQPEHSQKKNLKKNLKKKQTPPTEQIQVWKQKSQKFTLFLRRSPRGLYFGGPRVSFGVARSVRRRHMNTLLWHWRCFNLCPLNFPRRFFALFPRRLFLLRMFVHLHNLVWHHDRFAIFYIYTCTTQQGNVGVKQTSTWGDWGGGMPPPPQTGFQYFNGVSFSARYFNGQEIWKLQRVYFSAENFKGYTF